MKSSPTVRQVAPDVRMITDALSFVRPTDVTELLDLADLISDAQSGRLAAQTVVTR